MKYLKFLIATSCLVLTVSIIFAQAHFFETDSSGVNISSQKTAVSNNPINSSKKSAFKPRNVAIVLYQDVQLLDFAGPGEVFSDTETAQGEAAFNVYTVAASIEPIVSQGFVTIKPQYSFENAPKPDIVVFPGGDPSNFIKDTNAIAWAKKTADNAEIAMSVCNGARILGQTGLLDNKKVTTHWSSIERLRKEVPTATVLENTRFIDNGQLITTAGISAGIDGALHLVQRLIGPESAIKTARTMEYKWEPEK